MFGVSWVSWVSWLQHSLHFGFIYRQRLVWSCCPRCGTGRQVASARVRPSNTCLCNLCYLVVSCSVVCLCSDGSMTLKSWNILKYLEILHLTCSKCLKRAPWHLEEKHGRVWIATHRHTLSLLRLGSKGYGRISGKAGGDDPKKQKKIESSWNSWNSWII